MKTCVTCYTLFRLSDSLKTEEKNIYFLSSLILIFQVLKKFEEVVPTYLATCTSTSKGCRN